MTIHELELIAAVCPRCGCACTEADICTVGVCGRCDLDLDAEEWASEINSLHEMGLPSYE